MIIKQANIEGWIPSYAFSFHICTNNEEVYTHSIPKWYTGKSHRDWSWASSRFEVVV